MKQNTNVSVIKGHLRKVFDDGVNKLRSEPAADSLGDMSVPVYIMATAGMRNNTGEVPLESRDTMRRAWDAIHGLRREAGEDAIRRRVYGIGKGINDDIPYTVQVNKIRDKHSFVVPASDEGVYAWIALNQGLNRPDNWMPGVLELGGKSMQVAYADATDPAGKAVCLWNSRYYVTSRSWVLGVEESRLAAVEKRLLLAAGRLPGSVVYNPCLPSFQRSKLANTQIMGTGTGDFAKCLAMAESYLNSKLASDSLSSLDIQHLASRFYGVSSFWHTYKFFSRLGVYKEDSPYDPRLFKQAVEEYCTSSWLEPFPWVYKEDDKNLHKPCFAAAWMITLLHDRKGFQLRLSEQEAWKDFLHFKIEPEFADRSSWTLGAATMVAIHESANTFCLPGEIEGRYPPKQTRLTQVSSVDSSTPTIVTQPISNLVVESAQLVRAPSTPAAISGSLLPNLPFDALKLGSVFSVGAVSGILLIALVLIGYRYFSTRRVVLRSPFSDDKYAVEVDEQPVVVRSRLAFFDRGKGAIFLAGGDNISHV
jgi:hypothetical protein